MKQYKLLSIAVILGVGGVFAACSDWLDYSPKDKQTYEQQFGTKAGFRNAVNGVYTNISSNSLYGYNMSYGPLDYMGLLYNIPTSSTSRIEYKTATWTGTYASSTFSSIWSTAYSTILNANLILQAADEYKGTVLTEKDYNLIKGEMLGVRAFLHFDLLRLFGPIYTSSPSKLSIPYNTGVEAIRHDRLPADELVEKYLLPDLEASESLLKEVDPVITDGRLNSDGGEDGNWERYRQLRMNYYAVVLVKARLYLWMGDYEKALAEARKITDNDKVKELFPFVEPSKLLANSINPDRIFSTECLFGFYDSDMTTLYTSYFNGSLDVSSLLQPRKGYIDILFPNVGDYRRQSQWTGSSSSSGSEYDFVKYKSFTTSSTNPDFWATFYGLMRVSEAYYIASESLLMQNDLAGACDYLNVILQARGLPSLLAGSVNQNTLLKEIKYEYLREMRGEGQIYFMLKRFNQKFGMYTGGDSNLNGAEQPYFDSSPSPATRYSVPIPSDETN